MKVWGTTMSEDTNYKAVLANLSLVPTLHMDFPTLDLLGIREDVEWYLDKLGLREFMKQTHVL